jgi:hypothetical protein
MFDKLIKKFISKDRIDEIEEQKRKALEKLLTESDFWTKVD